MKCNSNARIGIIFFLKPIIPIRFAGHYNSHPGDIKTENSLIIEGDQMQIYTKVSYSASRE